MLTDSGERKRTNESAIYVCVALVVVLFGFVGYTAINGNIYRLTRGVDDCGYICGRENKDNGLKECTSPDKRVVPFTKVDISKDPRNPNITITHSECVKSCPPKYEETFNRCWKIQSNSTENPEAQFGSFLTNFAEDLSIAWPKILICVGVALVFSYILLILFRYAIKYVVWIIYIGLLVILAILSIVLLVLYFSAASSSDKQTKEAASGFLITSGVFALVAIVFALVLYFFRRRIAMVVQIFKEASKVLIDVPLIVLEPLLTFITIGLTCTTFLFFVMIIASSGDLTVKKDEYGNFDKATYEPNAGSGIAHVVNIIAFIWFTSFTFGCQNFIIASTVCQWFFTRSKDKLDSPIKRAFSHLLRFHIGSVCLGSLLITLVKIIKMIIENAKKSMRESDNAAAQMFSCCCDYLMQIIEEFLQYLMRNAYIIVALNGTPLIDSGKKAFRLIKENLVDVIVLNKFGDFVLFVGKLFVVAISGFVSYELIGKNEQLNYPAVPVVFTVIFAYLIIDCFMTVFEMTVDTIFVCFCEDCEINDGMTRPFFMSRGLMEVMQELKNTAGGTFNFNRPNPGGEAGQPMVVPAGWKFGNDQH